MVYFSIAWSVKFRAFGVTFGNYSDSKHIPLPPMLALAGDLLQPHVIYSYNDHGVVVNLALVKV